MGIIGVCQVITASSSLTLSKSVKFEKWCMSESVSSIKVWCGEWGLRAELRTAAVWLLSVSSGGRRGASSVWRSDRTGHRCSSSPLENRDQPGRDKRSMTKGWKLESVGGAHLCGWAWRVAAGSGRSWTPCCSRDEDTAALSPPRDAPWCASKKQPDTNTTI